MNASIVLYNPNQEQLSRLLLCLSDSPVVENIFLVDNSDKPLDKKFYGRFAKIVYIFRGKNIGYGAAHNIALRQSFAAAVDYHLVVNADIHFKPEILQQMKDFMDKHEDVALLSPRILSPDGELQYLAKRLPSPTDLILRRFVPDSIGRKRREDFCLKNTGYNRTMDVPYLSGCFMFLRSAALAETGLFDERFFMYPEDIDLTRRLHKRFHTLYYPEATVVHDHARASYHSLRMLMIHIVNMCRYFNKWGWIYDNERRQFNSAAGRPYNPEPSEEIENGENME